MDSPHLNESKTKVFLQMDITPYKTSHNLPWLNQQVYAPKLDWYY